MGGEEAREIDLGNLAARVHLPVPFRQLTGKFRSVSLANGFQKSRNIGLLAGSELGQLRLDFLHAHKADATRRWGWVNGGFVGGDQVRDLTYDD